MNRISGIIAGLVIGLLLGIAATTLAQSFGNPRFDERSRNWNERQYEQRQQRLLDEVQPRRPC